MNADNDDYVLIDEVGPGEPNLLHVEQALDLQHPGALGRAVGRTRLPGDSAESAAGGRRILTGEGVLWLASVRDGFANRIVGWATDSRATITLVLTALNHAPRSRDVQPGQLIFHSDKGAQYTALRFTQRLVDAGVAPSTGSTGDSYDTQSMLVGVDAGSTV